MSNTFIQKHWPPGSGGCTRDVQVGNDGQWQLKGTSKWKTGSDVMQNAINEAVAKGDRYAIYDFSGSKYYVEVDPNGKYDGDDDDNKDENKSDSGSDLENVDDLINDPEPGLAFVGDGCGQKVDIPFNTQQSVVSLKQDFADKMQCDPSEIKMLAYIDPDFIEIEKQTLEDNKVKDSKDLIIFKESDRREAVKKIIRAKKWEDISFRKQAKKWLKGTGNEGKQGIDNLIKKNGLDDGWNDVLAKMKYTDVLKIIKDENILSKIDQIRVDQDKRKKYNISDDQVAKLTYSEIAKMAKKTKALREQFYEDMSKTTLKGTDMKLDPDCGKIFDAFQPGAMNFYGIISLIDGKDLKAMGVPCKNVDSIKKGQVYIYPSKAHDKTIKFAGKTQKGYYVNGKIGGTGHGELCEISGLPAMYCGGFAIQPPTLKFRSGTCNSSKSSKVKGFDNGKALNKILQDCLKSAFKGTNASKFYNKVDDRPWS
eukprot:149092_1